MTSDCSISWFMNNSAECLVVRHIVYFKSQVSVEFIGFLKHLQNRHFRFQSFCDVNQTSIFEGFDSLIKIYPALSLLSMKHKLHIQSNSDKLNSPTCCPTNALGSNRCLCPCPYHRSFEAFAGRRCGVLYTAVQPATTFYRHSQQNYHPRKTRATFHRNLSYLW